MLVTGDHFIILSSARVDHGLFPVYPESSIRFHEHVVHDAANSIPSSDNLFCKSEPFLISQVLPAHFRCADGATRTGAIIRAAVQQRRSAAEAWRREEETPRAPRRVPQRVTPPPLAATARRSGYSGSSVARAEEPRRRRWRRLRLHPSMTTTATVTATVAAGEGSMAVTRAVSF